MFSIEESDKGGDLLVAPNGRRFIPGRFETPSVAELRCKGLSRSVGELEVLNIQGDVRDLHAKPEAAGATFQVASQFNCLEFIDASVTPESGVTRYIFDKTQGPACALACAASTVWRNYFLPLGGARGQRSDSQLNCLADVQALLGVLEVRNGYTFCGALDELSRKIGECDRDVLRAALRIGVQWDAEVTDPYYEFRKNPDTSKWEKACAPAGPVTQVFASALCVNPLQTEAWRPLAEIVLEGAYEATLAIAEQNWLRGGSRDVYLTHLGGNNFHNDHEWIERAMRRAFELYRQSGLRVFIVSRGEIMGRYRSLAAEYRAPELEANVASVKMGGKGSAPPPSKGKGKTGSTNCKDT